ncbi:SoxS protein [Paracoccus sediminicola]|uniref:SoxS protein n=1 Tax=Paracoccus sediminicola TaxID=3017783 RepID=UPI0022F0C823|nr:SoxS protein [Paracoccus sediminicola]WBU56962.1 SoxS protein [Paracoccus sediminicola]
MMRFEILCMLAALILASVGMAAYAGIRVSPVQLLMIRQDGCLYCARWESDIGAAYDDRPEGRAAPLMRINMHGPWPDGLALDRRPHLTPTFILVQNGQETGRIEGYPGEDEFWRRLSGILTENGVEISR